MDSSKVVVMLEWANPKSFKALQVWVGKPCTDCDQTDFNRQLLEVG